MDAVSGEPQTITRLLDDVRSGGTRAGDSLLDFVYGELGALARVHLARTGEAGHTLQPTALVHEAWLKIATHLEGLRDRQHFFAVASRAMRHVLTDHAKARARRKRDDGGLRVVLHEGLVDGHGRDEIDLVDLDDSLRKLARLDPRHARVVELRIFGGLTIAETARELSVSHTTVEHDWFTAKAWLRRELAPSS